ncbi:hypothetical protein [Hydrogenimonas sp.]
MGNYPKREACDYPFLSKLEDLIGKILKEKKRVFVAVSGKSGVGKSTFGKFVRTRGVGAIPPSTIAVIDDSVMTKEYLFGLIRRKIRIESDRRDDLRPFTKMLSEEKRVIFYISSIPSRRLSRADILITLSLEERERVARLEKRVGHGKKLEDLIRSDPSQEKRQMRYRFKLEGKIPS